MQSNNELALRVCLMLGKLENSDIPYVKARLANVRHSIGRPISESMEAWQFVFENLPDDLRGNKVLNNNEKVAMTVLQLYAIYKQGNSDAIMAEDEATEKNMGYVFRSLRDEEDTIAIDNRFNTMLTSDSFEELSYHLRTMIKILKSKNRNIKIDYGRLAKDLKQFADGYDEDLRLNWARDYYSYKGEKKDEE